MSLMEFCEILERRLVPTYRSLFELNLCDWCDHPHEPTMGPA